MPLLRPFSGGVLQGFCGGVQTLSSECTGALRMLQASRKGGSQVQLVVLPPVDAVHTALYRAHDRSYSNLGVVAASWGVEDHDNSVQLGLCFVGCCGTRSIRGKR